MRWRTFDFLPTGGVADRSHLAVTDTGGRNCGKIYSAQAQGQSKAIAALLRPGGEAVLAIFCRSSHQLTHFEWSCVSIDGIEKTRRSASFSSADCLVTSRCPAASDGSLHHLAKISSGLSSRLKTEFWDCSMEF